MAIIRLNALVTTEDINFMSNGVRIRQRKGYPLVALNVPEIKHLCTFWSVNK